MSRRARDTVLWRHRPAVATMARHDALAPALALRAAPSAAALAAGVDAVPFADPRVELVVEAAEVRVAPLGRLPAVVPVVGERAGEELGERRPQRTGMPPAAEGVEEILEAAKRRSGIAVLAVGVRPE